MDKWSGKHQLDKMNRPASKLNLIGISEAATQFNKHQNQEQLHVHSSIKTCFFAGLSSPTSENVYTYDNKWELPQKHKISIAQTEKYGNCVERLEQKLPKHQQEDHDNQLEEQTHNSDHHDEPESTKV